MVSLPAAPPTPEALATTTWKDAFSTVVAAVVAVDDGTVVAVAASVGEVAPPLEPPSSLTCLRMKKPNAAAMTATTTAMVGEGERGVPCVGAERGGIRRGGSLLTGAPSRHP